MSIDLLKKPLVLPALLAALGTAGCGGDGDIEVLMDDKSDLSRKPSELPPIADNVEIVACPETGSGATDYKDGFTMLINDPHEFRERYLSSLPYNQSEPPEVDFDSKSVIAVHAGRRSSASQRVRITELYEGSEAIDVTYQVVVPCGGDDTALTYPFCFVSIDKTDKAVNFEEAPEICVER